MKTTQFEFKTEILEASLPALRSTRETLLKQRDEIDRQIASLNTVISKFEGGTNGSRSKPRMRKGEALKLITATLAGGALTLKEICSVTNVSSSTAFRVLSKNKQTFRLDETTGKWSLISPTGGAIRFTVAGGAKANS